MLLQQQQQKIAAQDQLQKANALEAAGPRAASAHANPAHVQQMIQGIPAMHQAPLRPQPRPVDYQSMKAMSPQYIPSSFGSNFNAANPRGTTIMSPRGPIPFNTSQQHGQPQQQTQLIRDAQHHGAKHVPMNPASMMGPPTEYQRSPAPVGSQHRPGLTSSRSDGSIPTVAQTLFGAGPPAPRLLPPHNPLANIFSQQQQNTPGNNFHNDYSLSFVTL